MKYYSEKVVEGLKGSVRKTGIEVYQVNNDLIVFYGEKVNAKTGIVKRINVKESGLKFRNNTDEFVYTIKFYNRIPKKYAKMIGVEKVNYCKYCGSPTDSVDENVLCEECRNLFGHTFYSEL